ncbi:MAG: hypothetical protein JSW11_12345 [Candidatus Heimdallarchaeota archaeon]|nr:MAG: hypothetical protein JSW11_12345 [Candidatus Heimdallarchaeota archaeon]
MRKQDYLALLPIFLLFTVLFLIIIVIPVGSLLIVMFTASYRQDVIMITRANEMENITGSIGNLTAKNLSSAPKLLSALQQMVQDDKINQKIVEITVKERDHLVQLFEELNFPLSCNNPIHVYFENILLEIILAETVS